MIAIFTLAGYGKRFREAGYAEEKIFLPLHGVPLVVWASTQLQSLDPVYVYLLRADLASRFKALPAIPPGLLHCVRQKTAGPLQTLLDAEELLHTLLDIYRALDTPEDILVCDGDSYMDPHELQDAITIFRESRPLLDGGITVRKASNPQYAYADVAHDWTVGMVREKDPFTPWSATGPYWFRNGRILLQAARQAHAAQEVSIAPVYNYLKRVRAVPVESFQHLGTPEEYTRALQAYSIGMEHDRG